MQLHQLKSKNKQKDRKRVGRGGKRGTYSGHGSKGQKSRAGARIRPGFRGGDNPIWKLFPKQRGASKKVDIKHRSFQVKRTKAIVVNLNDLNSRFESGDTISPSALVKKSLIEKGNKGVKILAEGELIKKLTFVGLKFSKTAQEKIAKAGGTIR
jgi:large subunit ribosomal protein L15